MIPLEKPGSGGSSPAATSGSGRAGRGPSGPCRPPPPPQARGLLTEIRAAVRTEPFQDSYSLCPGRELGRGKFAVVRKCIKKDSGIEFAAKFMRKRRKGQDCRMEIIHEIAVLELAQDNPWVINLHEVYETASEIILVLEYAAGGEIFDQCVADREEAFKEKDVQRLMRQILEGVHFLHTHDVVHLDLKPQNILLTSESPLGDIKIVDFGLSRILKNSEELREIMGTPEYVAPEILSYDPISMATDMWSIGVLTYVMLTGISPFLGNDKQETFLNISQMNLSYSEEEFDVLSESAVDFIRTLLVKKPEDRATAEECLKHPWLTQSSIQEPSFRMEKALEANALQEGHSVPEINSDTDKSETEESIVTEELIVVTSYTLGQCRQSEKEKMEQKAISKRFKFEEPLLQEIPGEFIY
ncbi:serine/threonine-protein kinase 17A [Rhinopithecus roxellana]|uniref:Serine/threonine-protein kinase 17A n=2 Tax=Rhinopithecus TaxID=542827 RepID=A0A2K6L6I4_RHIBE|nr:serine/threonine-protein kinase 17A [Rhinopithecus roxellana]XP_017750411.1 PREDICTED: serine/threonine-protein kinase 17A isoform X1 [Rhinopithecus bieti]